MHPHVRYEWTLLRAGRFMLDGGGMFGLIPKTVWSRFIETDDRNRITLCHNALLLRGGGRTVLIEAGTGDKLDAKMSDIFGLDGRTIETAVIEAGVDPNEVHQTVVSHLHFDHAGGLTRRARDGETPDWVATGRQASGDQAEVCFTFPNAEVVVQRQEWLDALANDSVMTRTYFADHLLPLEIPLVGERPRLRLVESPIPFPHDQRPHRKDLPKAPVSNRRTEIAPGIWVFLVPGHTWGQQAVMFEDVEGRTVVFTPDVMPTHFHVGAAYSLGYDVEPYTSMVTKRWFLGEAADAGWHLVLDHEPGDAVQRVHRSDRGWFELESTGLTGCNW
ncbi:MAG TPA: MBL fold metallo-hydrolase [Phycisphaerales bacterium]|nr:MBL fold metallo-hydrolase [Phycisphaerales bacterium]